MSREINVLVDGKTVRLDDQFVYEAKVLYNEAASLSKQAEEKPVPPEAEIERDMEDIEANRRNRGIGAKIAFTLFFVLAVGSLALPLDPFLSRLPIFGVFAGIGGIILFSFLLAGNKRIAKREIVEKVLEKYGVSDPDDIDGEIEERTKLKEKSDEAFQKLLAFIRTANPKAETPYDCQTSITTLETILHQ